MYIYMMILDHLMYQRNDASRRWIATQHNSVASAACYRTVRDIILEAQASNPKMAVVVSAMGGKPKVRTTMHGCLSVIRPPTTPPNPFSIKHTA